MKTGFGKRILVFLGVNLLVIASISILLNIFNVQPYLTSKGLNYQQLMMFCAIWGFGGAFISLAISRMMAKWMMGVKVLDPQKSSLSPEENWILQSVHHYSRKAGLSTMPEVGIYESPEPNAFATGPTKSRALVAVSTGLLRAMDKDAVEGVIAHEVAHIANGDMVTMTLVQGVMNAFVMFIARVISFFICQNVKEESRPMVNMLTTIVLEIALSVLAMFAVAYVSRVREYRADAGAAQLAGRDKMKKALVALQDYMDRKRNPEVETHGSLATMQISTRPNSWLQLLSTHPPLQSRIEALERGRT